MLKKYLLSSLFLLSSTALWAAPENAQEAIDESISLFESAAVTSRGALECFSEAEKVRLNGNINQALEKIGVPLEGLSPENKEHLWKCLSRAGDVLGGKIKNFDCQIQRLKSIETASTYSISIAFNDIMSSRLIYLNGRVGMLQSGLDLIPTDDDFIKSADLMEKTIAIDSIDTFYAIQKTLELLYPYVDLAFVSDEMRGMIDMDSYLRDRLTGRQKGKTHPDLAFKTFGDPLLLGARHSLPTLSQSADETERKRLGLTLQKRDPFFFELKREKLRLKFEEFFVRHAYSVTLRLLPEAFDFSARLKTLKAQLSFIDKETTRILIPMDSQGRVFFKEPIYKFSFDFKTEYKKISNCITAMGPKGKKPLPPKASSPSRKKVSKPSIVPQPLPAQPIHIQPVSSQPSPLPEVPLYTPKAPEEKGKWQHKDREARREEFEKRQEDQRVLPDVVPDVIEEAAPRPQLTPETIETLQILYKRGVETYPTALDWDRFVATWKELRRVVDGVDDNMSSLSGSARKFRGGPLQEGRKLKARSFVIHEPHLVHGHTLGRGAMDRIGVLFQEKFGWTPESLGL